MRIWLLVAVVLFAFASAPALAAAKPIEPVIACEALATASLDHAVGATTQIYSARIVEAAGMPPYCDVRGNIDPAVGFEVHLPLRHWTERFVQTGCGGLCGVTDIRLDKAETCKPATQGELVLASTDMGHAGDMDGAWGRDNYQARVDFAYRGVHVTTLAAKALIQTYYGRPARYSYFTGCSDGGREALMEAQRYPRDFNGILAGAPAMNFTTQNSFYHAWNALQNRHLDGSPILTADKLPLLHQEVIAQCDAADGLKDGLISDPVRCHPDLSKITCQKAQPADSCLTPEQVHVVQEIYRGAHDAAGRGLVISGPLPGSEINWVGVFVPPQGQIRSLSAMISEGTIKNLDSDPNPPITFTLSDLRFDEVTFRATTRLHGLYDSTDANLSSFAKAGGRLILWHGLADPHISPMNTIAYYESMQRQLGNGSVEQFARLYLFPGGDHCGGGEGPFDFDVLSQMMSWVEQGLAPGALLASHSTAARKRPGGVPPGPPKENTLPPVADNSSPPARNEVSTPATPQDHIDRTRDVYPYPYVARYVGSGSVDTAANYSSVLTEPWPVNGSWFGASFFAGHEHLGCDSKKRLRQCPPET